ncbi:MAG: ABC transporter permease, partial [Dehalococcoidia bacterium]|nr:ABC transporter permease [Dehalococcoidia bacterium]
MLTYALRRAVLAVLVVWAVSLAVFVLLRVLPGEPALPGLGVGATAEAVASARAELGLDEPLPVQYGRWIADLSRADLGA